MKLSILTGMLLLLFTVPAASADSVTWTLSNFVFDDSGTATGSFVYDASTNTFSSIHIVTSNGTVLSGATYTALDPGFGPFPFNIALVTVPGLANYTGTTVIELGLTSSLTNAGGSIATDLNEFSCTNANCSTANDLRGTLDGGTIVGTVSTPEPASLLLLAAGLTGLLAFVKRSPAAA